MMSMGTPEINVPKTGINPNTSTISESVKINGNTAPPWRSDMMMSPMDVRTALTMAMSD
jgi:hypothetical protein